MILVPGQHVSTLSDGHIDDNYPYGWWILLPSPASYWIAADAWNPSSDGVGDPNFPILFNFTVPLGTESGSYILRLTGPNPNFWSLGFDVVCLAVDVSVSQGSSAPISNTSPQQYRHTFSASAVARGGTGAITYTWSTSVGSFSPSSPTGSTATIEVANTSPNFSGLTGGVTCTASDSGGCTATDSADVSDAGAPTEGPGPTVPPSGGPPSPPAPSSPNEPPGSPPGGSTCSADGATTMTLSKQAQTTGNNTVSSGSSLSVLTLR